ncbi:MAG: hypothetical protein U5L45_08295 [Saprospiraceae bacterium]|nr:hypothetical protein [Saprospiraceae bacterium]
MEVKHLYPLSIGLFLVTWTACTLQNAPSSQAKEVKEVVAAKVVRAVTYVDKAAVVPFPKMRQVTFTVEDSTNISLNYAEFKGDIDASGERINMENANQREEIYDQILELAELPDGIDIKPGKQNCVGSQGIDVSVIFNNGDTSRFSIMGGARCDKSLCPPFWHIDSLTNLLLADKNR